VERTAATARIVNFMVKLARCLKMRRFDVRRLSVAIARIASTTCNVRLD
jgi:hypothetical protein